MISFPISNTLPLSQLLSDSIGSELEKLSKSYDRAPITILEKELKSTMGRIWVICDRFIDLGEWG